MFNKLEDPCKLCLVRGCCQRLESRCKLLHTWNHRNDWIKQLTVSILAVPLAMFTILISIAFGLATKEGESHYYDD